MTKQKRGKKESGEDIRQKRRARQQEREQFKNPPLPKRQHRGQR